MLTPKQHSEEYLACLRLWAAVFQQGINDLGATAGQFGEIEPRRAWHKARNTRKAARKWAASDEVYPGSFVWLCELLGCTPEWARRKCAERDIPPIGSTATVCNHCGTAVSKGSLCSGCRREVLMGNLRKAWASAPTTSYITERANLKKNGAL